MPAGADRGDAGRARGPTGHVRPCHRSAGAALPSQARRGSLRLDVRASPGPHGRDRRAGGPQSQPRAKSEQSLGDRARAGLRFLREVRSAADLAFGRVGPGTQPGHHRHAGAAPQPAPGE